MQKVTTLIHSDPLFKRLSVIPEIIVIICQRYFKQSISWYDYDVNQYEIICSLPDMLSLNLTSNEDLILFKPLRICSKFLI